MRSFTDSDYKYLNLLRGLSIFRVMLVHLGLSWFYPPYSPYVGILFPVLFFVSGAVSYRSFAKHGGVGLHLRKRTIDTIVPYYIFMFFVFAFGLLEGSLYVNSFSELVRWMLVSPTQSAIDFPIGQIWFIKTLLLLHFGMVVLFKLSLRRPEVLLVAFLGGVVLCFVSVKLPIRDMLGELYVIELIGVFSVWNALVLSACYLAGAIFYHPAFKAKELLRPILASFLVLVFLSIYLMDYDFEYSVHYENKSPFYISLSVFVIAIILALQKQIMAIIEFIKPLEWLVLFCSTHSYSLFLLHTVVLFYVEKLLGWHDLSASPTLAVARLVLVILLTMLIAPVFSKITKKLKSRVERSLMPGWGNKNSSSKSRGKA